MSVSAIESLEREDCGGNPKTRKEPTEEKLRYHVLIVGEGGTRLGGYTKPKNTVEPRSTLVSVEECSIF